MAEFFVQVPAGVYSYVQSYGTVDGTEWHMAGFSYDVLSFMERRGWFLIILLFMSVQIKHLNNARYI